MARVILLSPYRGMLCFPPSRSEILGRRPPLLPTPQDRPDPLVCSSPLVRLEIIRIEDGLHRIKELFPVAQATRHLVRSTLKPFITHFLSPSSLIAKMLLSIIQKQLIAPSRHGNHGASFINRIKPSPEGTFEPHDLLRNVFGRSRKISRTFLRVDRRFLRPLLIPVLLIEPMQFRPHRVTVILELPVAPTLVQCSNEPSVEVPRREFFSKPPAGQSKNFHLAQTFFSFRFP